MMDLQNNTAMIRKMNIKVSFEQKREKQIADLKEQISMSIFERSEKSKELQITNKIKIIRTI